MKLAKVLFPNQEQHVVIVGDDSVQALNLTSAKGTMRLSDILYSDNPSELAKSLVDKSVEPVALETVQFLAPIDSQEVWAAGVTYKRSQVARMEESKSGADHYAMVYTADRPEIFFKSTPTRVVGPNQPVRIRKDATWSVPEPEFVLMLDPQMNIKGYTIGNDMSSRDIEGENPLYLPQAKVYNQSCAMGPYILVKESELDFPETKINLSIQRAGSEVFTGETNLGQIVRKLEDLASWLGRELDFPHGAALFTGTGIIPPDSFTLNPGDLVRISITGLGTLENPVVQG